MSETAGEEAEEEDQEALQVALLLAWLEKSLRGFKFAKKAAAKQTCQFCMPIFARCNT